MKLEPEREQEALAALRAAWDAYEQRDIAKVMAFYSDDPDMVNLGSGRDERCIGPEGVLQALTRDFGQSECSSVEFTWTSASGKGDVAWLAAEGVVHVKTAEGDVLMEMRLTAVLLHQGDRWLIAQSHVSVPAQDQAEGQSFPPPGG